MASQRRCRNCRRLFRPHPRVKDRQHTCSRPECQRERHRQGCADWRSRRVPEREVEGIQKRIRGKRTSEAGGTARGGAGGSRPPRSLLPGNELNWDEIQAANGVQLAVLLWEILRVVRAHVAQVERQLRDEISRQSTEIKGESSQSPGRPP